MIKSRAKNLFGIYSKMQYIIMLKNSVK